jgi:MYXO-CTERM domain-containing protein
MLLSLLAGVAVQAAPARLVADLPIAPSPRHAAVAATGVEDLRWVQSRPWAGGTLQRFQQHHLGVPVEGAIVTLRVDAGGRARFLTDATLLAPAVAALPAAPRRVVSREDAITAAEVAVPGAVAVSAERLISGPLGSGSQRSGAQNVYRVRAFDPSLQRGYRVLVAVETGVVVRVTPILHHADAQVYAENPAVSDLISVTLRELDSEPESLSGTYVDVKSAVFDDGDLSREALAAPDDAGDFIFEPEPDATDDPFSEAMAYHHLTEVAAHYDDVYDHDFGSGMSVTVNYRETENGDYDNAFMTRDQFGQTVLVFGQGGVDFAYDADVLVHEFGHGIIYDTSSLVPGGGYDEYGANRAPDAMHEGLADAIAALWHGNSHVGEYYGGRDLDNDHRCPDDLVGESHEDGKIIGGAMWDVRDIVGAEAAELLMMGMLGTVSSSPSFLEVGEVMVALAEDLASQGVVTDADVVAIDAAMEARGMFECGRSVPMALDTATDVALTFFGGVTFDEERCERIRDAGYRLPGDQQLQLTLPDDVDPVSLTFTFTVEVMGGDDLREFDVDTSVFLRQGDLVTFDYEEIETERGGFMLPVGDEYDVGDDVLPDEITLLSDGDVPLEAGETYALAFTHMNCAPVVVSVVPTLEVAVEEEAPTEAPPATADETGGCGCATPAGASGPSSAPAGGLAVLLFGLIGVVRRRR